MYAPYFFTGALAEGPFMVSAVAGAGNLMTVGSVAGATGVPAGPNASGNGDFDSACSAVATATASVNRTNSVSCSTPDLSGGRPRQHWRASRSKPRTYRLTVHHVTGPLNTGPGHQNTTDNGVTAADVRTGTSVLAVGMGHAF